MSPIFFILAIFSACLCHADFVDHFRKVPEKKTDKSSIKNIDFIYLINLDQRPEKLEKSLSQLSPYGIVPHRFPAIYGWDLPFEAFSETSLKFSPGMVGGRWVAFFSPEGKGRREWDFLKEDSYGKSFFYSTMSPGAIGCSLSHLSILQDAYDSGYETIWILEDDFIVKKDPHLLGSLIQELNGLVGKEGWDVLYTGLDLYGIDVYRECHFWRPDFQLSSEARYERSALGQNFMKIGSRFHTHSMIVRRSGMKKILDFEKKHGIFLAYDCELSMIPDIKLFSLTSDLIGVVPFSMSASDTASNLFGQKEAWEKYKKDTLDEQPQIYGWCSLEKAEKLMEFIYKEKPKTCVEIGVLGGSVTYPIAKSLSFLKKGTVYAIDAWDNEAAIERVEVSEVIQWWKAVNLEEIYQGFCKLISTKDLGNYCLPIRKRSSEALKSFADGSIDMLYVDGNISEQGSLEDVQLYLPKVKEGGYIWLNDADIPDRVLATAFLMNNCTWIKEQSLGKNCVLFQKKKSKTEKLGDS